MDATSVTGLILTGGGARAAYQVGVLKALVRIRRDCGGIGRNPFDVIDAHLEEFFRTLSP